MAQVAPVAQVAQCMVAVEFPLGHCPRCLTSRMGTMVTSPCNGRAWNSKNSSFGLEQHFSAETTSLFRRAWKYCITFSDAIFAVSQIRRNCLPNSGCPQSHWSDWRLAPAGSSIVLIPASIMDAAATELVIPPGTFPCYPSASKVIGLTGCFKPPQKHQPFWIIPGRIKRSATLKPRLTIS